MGARFGMLGFVKALGAIRVTPMSGIELSELLGWTSRSFNLLMRQLHAYRVVHVAGWTEPSRHRPPLPRFKFGDGPDMPAPLTAWGAPSAFSEACLRRVQPGASVTALVTICRSLRRRPHSVVEMAAEAGINESRCSEFVAAAHEAQLMHIATWMRKSRRGPFVPYFVWGAGTDAPKPRPMTSAESTQAYYRRRKAKLTGEPVFCVGKHFRHALQPAGASA